MEDLFRDVLKAGALALLTKVGVEPPLPLLPDCREFDSVWILLAPALAVVAAIVWAVVHTIATGVFRGDAAAIGGAAAWLGVCWKWMNRWSAEDFAEDACWIVAWMRWRDTPQFLSLPDHQRICVAAERFNASLGCATKLMPWWYAAHAVVLVVTAVTTLHAFQQRCQAEARSHEGESQFAPAVRAMVPAARALAEAASQPASVTLYPDTPAFQKAVRRCQKSHALIFPALLAARAGGGADAAAGAAVRVMSQYEQQDGVQPAAWRAAVLNQVTAVIALLCNQPAAVLHEATATSLTPAAWSALVDRVVSEPAPADAAGAPGQQQTRQRRLSAAAR